MLCINTIQSAGHSTPYSSSSSRRRPQERQRPVQLTGVVLGVSVVHSCGLGARISLLLKREYGLVPRPTVVLIELRTDRGHRCHDGKLLVLSIPAFFRISLVTNQLERIIENGQGPLGLGVCGPAFPNGARH